MAATEHKPSVQIRKVESRSDLRRFVDFHYDLYEGNAYDAPTLFSDDMRTLDKEKNAAFEFYAICTNRELPRCKMLQK